MKSTRTLKTNSPVSALLLSTALRKYRGVSDDAFWSAVASVARHRFGLARSALRSLRLGVRSLFTQSANAQSHPKRRRRSALPAHSIWSLKTNSALLPAMFALLLIAGAARAQTSVFTYQGKLTDGGTPANGNYDLQFALWDSASAGMQIGSTQTVSSVAVSNGIFTVTLDFGAGAFPGASRFLEIGARASGGGSFTTLAPRQQITSTPYGIRSASAAAADNATQLGGIAASGFIQNSTALQASTNFNISGNGTAGGTLSGNVVNSTTQYNIGGIRVLSVPGTANTFAGLSAGANNTTGGENSFFGANAGFSNTTGDNNAFFGRSAGFANTTGAQQNSFFGGTAGSRNTTGINNTFVGFNTGGFTTSESLNTFIGSQASGTAGVTNAVAIGAGASVEQSNSIVLGNDAIVGVGIGTHKPVVMLQVVGDIRVGTGAANGCVQRFDGTAIAGACSSDIRLKRDIRDFPNLLNRLAKLQPVHYYWRSGEYPDKHFGDSQSYGLVAQEVERVLPELVGEDAQGYKTVDYSKLPLMMLQAIKELKAENDSLRQQNAAIDARLKALEQTIQQTDDKSGHRPTMRASSSHSSRR